MPEPGPEGGPTAGEGAARRGAPWWAWALVAAAVVALAGGMIHLAVSRTRGGGSGGSVTMSGVDYQSVVVGPVSYLDLRHAYAGKVVVLNYMAAGCAACSAQIPKLVAAYDRLRHHGVQLVGVSLRTSRAGTRAMIARLGIDYPVYLDSSGAAARARFGLHGVPATLVFKGGRLLRRFGEGASASDVTAYLATLTGVPHE